MDTMDHLRDLLAFDLWANRRLVKALDVEEAPETAGELLVHVILAQELWMDRVDGIDAARAVDGTVPDEGFERAIERAHTRLADRLERAGTQGLSHRVQYADLSGNPHASSLHDIFVHLVQHGTHHRAQAASQLARAGLARPHIDFIVYTREEGRTS